MPKPYRAAIAAPREDPQLEGLFVQAATTRAIAKLDFDLLEMGLQRCRPHKLGVESRAPLSVNKKPTCRSCTMTWVADSILTSTHQLSDP